MAYIGTGEYLGQHMREQLSWYMETQDLGLCSPRVVRRFLENKYLERTYRLMEVAIIGNTFALTRSVCRVDISGSHVGSGFLLFKEHVLTCGHLITTSTGTAPVTVTFKSVTSRVHLTASLRGLDRHGRYQDFALLKLETVPEDAVPLMSVVPKERYCEDPYALPELCNHDAGGHVLSHTHMTACLILEHPKPRDGRLGHLMRVLNYSDIVSGSDEQAPEVGYFHDRSSGCALVNEHSQLIGMYTGKYQERGTLCKFGLAASIGTILRCIKVMVDTTVIPDVFCTK